LSLHSASARPAKHWRSTSSITAARAHARQFREAFETDEVGRRCSALTHPDEDGGAAGME